MGFIDKYDVIQYVLKQFSNLEHRILVLYSDGEVVDAGEIIDSAIVAAKGEYTLILKPGDELAEHALYQIAIDLRQYPSTDLFYGDEDQLDSKRCRCNPHFKPEWNLELFYSQDYLGCSRFYKTALLRELGGFRSEFNGCMEFEFTMRLLEKSRPIIIRHIPAVIYHQHINNRVEHSKHSAEIGISVLQKYLCSINSDLIVSSGKFPFTYRVCYPLPERMPKVTLIIPTRDQCELLRKCVTSICEKTSYPNWEIVIIDNQSEQPETLSYLEELNKDHRIRVLRYAKPFNYSAINNFAVSQSHSQLIGLINNDIEVISPEWLTEMVSHAVRPGIGAVGAKLLFQNGLIQHAGIVLGIMGVAGHGHKYYPASSPGYHFRLHLVQEVSAVTAACLVVRRDLYNEVGGFDEENLKVAYNDVDFCLKLRAAGYCNLWTPYAELYHHESMTRGRADTLVNKKRLKRESVYMRKKWGDVLQNDPYYSPYLTLEREDFSLAWVPRHLPPWVEG